jgi:light-regulated signal transduction histidine kinase (bacteriophytochrome)
MQMLIKDLLEYSQIGAKEKKVKPTDCSGVVEKQLEIYKQLSRREMQ